MDRLIFRAAMEGQVQVLRQNKHHLPFQTTPTNNTVLHVAAQFGRCHCVEEALRICPGMLRMANTRGETALHIAAREGHTQIVKVLIEHAKELEKDIESGIGAKEELMRMKNKTEDTPMHLAASNRHVEVVKLLAGEDPGYSYSGNRAGESPLYLAVERGFSDVVVAILKTCSSTAHGGPGGRTALHAAVFCSNQAMTAVLLEKHPSITQSPDDHGWTPLHYAAHLNYVSRIKQLLKRDKMAAYLTNKDGKTALHIAAGRGHTAAMKVLVSHCPDCSDLTDARGRNILHIAVESNEKEAVNYILEDPLFGSLVNAKDEDGNTPLHLLAAKGRHITSLIVDPRVDKGAHNLEGLTALDIASCPHRFVALKSLIRRELAAVGAPRGLRNLINKDEGEKGDTAPEHLNKVRETHLIVAALIATVTFAAGFTLPGGGINCGDQNPNGSLTKRAAFKAFFLTDTLAMVLSTCAVFIYFVAALYANQTKLFNRIFWAFCLTILAMGAMVLAFVTGTYAALPGASGFTVAACVVGCCFFLVYFYVLKKLYFDKISRRSRLCGHFHGHGMMSHSISDL